MESLDLTYKLIALKIKSKTLGQIYFMPQVFQENSHCYDKRKKYENLFIFAATIFSQIQGYLDRGWVN